MKDVKIALLAFLLNLTTGLQAQKLNYVQYTTDNGLPSSEAYAVLQDSLGYIWIATDNGVSRFNGYEFVNFSRNDGLIDKNVLKLYLDYKGRVWFIHSNKTLSYYENDQIVEYQYNHLLKRSPRKGGSDTEISQIRVDNKGNLLVKWAAHGFSLISSDGKYFYKDKGLTNQYYLDYNEDFDDFCIVIPKNLTAKLKNNVFEHVLNLSFNNMKYKLKKHLDIFCPSRYRTIKNNDAFIFSIDSTLFVLENNKIQSVTLPSFILSLCVSKDNIWVGLQNQKGVAVLNRYNLSYTTQKFLEGNSISHIIKDNEGEFWLTSLENGIYYCKLNRFLSIGSKIYVKAILADSLIVTSDSKGYLYKIGNTNKISKLTEKPIDFEYNIQYCNNRLFTHGHSSNEIIENDVRMVSYENHETNLKTWISSNHFQFVNKDDFFILSKFGLSYFKKKINNSYFIDHNSFPELKHKNLTCSEVYNDSIIYISSYAGLYQLVPDTSNITKSNISFLGIQYPELNTRIEEIKYNPFDKRMWLRTKNSGLIAWVPQTKEISIIDKSKGLLDDWVTSFSIKDSIIILGTKLGLQKITIKSLESCKIQTFTTTHGLPTNEINNIAIRDNNAYIATDKGICYFNIYNLSENKHPPEIIISNIKINDKDVNIKKEHILKYKQNDFRFFVTGISYKSQPNIRYKYRIREIDTSWIFTNNREIVFPRLLPDKYTFEVMAQNADGFWSKEPASVSFTIKPPYWETLWFRSMMGIILLFLIWLIFQYRMRELNKRNLIRIEEERKRNKLKIEAEKEKSKLENNLTKTKQKLVTQQLNPHFLFNTMSSIQYMIINNRKMEAVGLLSKFARMMRQGLEYSRVEYASLDQSIEFFRNYIDLKTINLKEKVAVNIDTTKVMSAIDCSIPPMLIQPFIENAIIHGLTPKAKDMKLSLIFMEEGKNIKCIIEDNGVGRKQSAKIKQKQAESHKSFGVKIINETLEMMNTLHGENYQVKYTDLIDANKKACGTRVEIDFPKFKN